MRVCNKIKTRHAEGENGRLEGFFVVPVVCFYVDRMGSLCCWGVEMIYRDGQHAMIRAAAVDTISTSKPAEWQQQYHSGFVDSLTARAETESLPPADRLAQDSMTRALIKRTVKRAAFYAMVAKYSANEPERAKAIEELAKLSDVNASHKFKLVMIWSWASEHVKRGVIAEMVSKGGQSRRTLERRRHAIIKWLNSLESEVITDISVVLKERGLIDEAA